MKYLQIFVVLFNVAFSCIASMEIDLEPTPLAFKPFFKRDLAQQQRDLCTVDCSVIARDFSDVDEKWTKLSISSVAASLEYDLADFQYSSIDSEWYAAQAASQSAADFCESNSDSTTVVDLGTDTKCPSFGGGWSSWSSTTSTGWTGRVSTTAGYESFKSAEALPSFN